VPQCVSPASEELLTVTTKEDFGCALTRLKDAGDLTIREVARRIRTSGQGPTPVASLGDYFAGKHLPNAGTLAKILNACDVTDPELQSAWEEARQRARVRPGRPAADEPAPYRGLACFRREDAQWFFGRAELSALALARAEECRAAGRPLMVVGPSGAGKSSLLRAGLIPLLAPDGEDAPVLAPDGEDAPVLVPGADPVTELAKVLADPPAVIVVDQFEEIFTPAVAEGTRQRFVEMLFGAAAADGGGRRTVVVIGLRADFYGQALQYPLLARALQDGQVVVGPMSAAELRQAIVEPARLAKTSVDEALAELLLRELRPPGSVAHDAGTLPLLSYALAATWGRHRSGRLTVADYLETGGITNALRNAADQALGSLDEAGRAAARRMFLRLVWVAEDAPETRRRVTIEELTGGESVAPRPALEDLTGGESGAGRAALETFVAHRLLTADDGAVEITHEVLLDAWPVLRGWIDASRADLLIRRRVTEAAREWAARGRDDGDLLRGGKLAMARSLASDPGKRAELTDVERDLLDASLAAERARQRAERRTARRLRNLACGLAAAVLAAGALTAYAFGQRDQAAAQRNLATTQRDLATSRQIAGEAAQLRGQDPGLAAQLSVAAYHVATTPEARGALLDSSAAAMPTRLTGPAGIVQAVALSPDRQVLAAVDDTGGLWLWNVAHPGTPKPLGHPVTRLGQPEYAAAFSPDGRLLAVAGAADTVQLFDVADPAAPTLITTLGGPGNTVYSVAFSQSGQMLAAGSADGNVWLWSITADGHATGRHTLRAGGGYVQTVAFSPGGGVLAAGTAAGTVRLWNVTNPAKAASLGHPLTGPTQAVYSVAFSPDGSLLAAGSRDSDVYLYNVKKRSLTGKLTGATSWVNAVAFSPDGSLLAAGGSDDTVRLWDVASRTAVAEFAHPGPVTGVAWDGSGTLVTGAADGAVRLWRVPPPVLAAGSVVNGVAFSRDDRVLAVASNGLQLWDPAARRPLSAMQTVSAAVPEAVAFAPGQQVIATGNSDGTVRLWYYSDGGTLNADGPALRGAATGQVEAVAFSPRGTLLASGGDDGTVRLWAVTGTAPPRPVTVLHAFGGIVFTVAFSPNGQLLAAAGSNDTIKLWSLADPAAPQLLTTLTGPTSTVYSVAFSPDGSLLAAGSADRSVYLWRVTSPRHPSRDGAALTGPASYVYALAFSPNGSLLAAGSTDDTVWLWSMADPPALYATLTGPTSYVYAVAFSPDGRTLAAGSADGTVRLWDTSPATAAAGVCAAAGDPITAQEWARFVPGVSFGAPCR
jgi:WD40 repeat protein